MATDFLESKTRLYRRTFQRLRDEHVEMKEELDFCFKLDHYKQKNDDEKAGDRPKPRGRELKQLVEHEAAVISRSDIFFDVLPQDQDEDPLDSEIVRAILKWEIFHPEKGYQEARDIMVLGALAARMWVSKVDFHPGIGPFGEIVFSNADGRDVGWDPYFRNPHHWGCRFLMERCRIPIWEIEEKGWENTSGLQPDSNDDEWETSSDTPNELRRRGEEAGEPDDEGMVRVIKLWERGVNEKQSVTKRLALPVGEQHMGCIACGYEGPMQATVDQRLPEIGTTPCPECGGVTERIDHATKDAEELAFARGQRFSIFAPHQKRLFIPPGPWPNGLIHLPYCCYQPKPNPAHQLGESETFDNRSMQCASNEVMRQALEHLENSKVIHGMPRTGVEAFDGQPYQMNPYQGQNFWYTPDMPPQGVISVKGGEVPPGLNTVFQMIQAVFRGNMGIPDLGLGPAQSRDIAVGTIRALIESGELGTEHKIERLRWQEGPYIGAVYDLCRSTYTPARLRRMRGENGLWQMFHARGKALPNYDVMLITSPSLLRMNQAEIQTWIEFASAAPWMQKFLARKMNIPITEVLELHEEKKKMMLEQPELLVDPSANGKQKAGGGSPLPTGLQQRMGGATHGAL